MQPASLPICLNTPRGQAMSRAKAARLVLSMLVAACTAALLQPVPGIIATASPAPPSTRSTLNVGMWTLWHDRTVRLIPAAHDDKITIRTCTGCAALTLKNAVTLQATGNSLRLVGTGKTGTTSRIELIRSVTLSAHGE